MAMLFEGFHAHAAREPATLRTRCEKLIGFGSLCEVTEHSGLPGVECCDLPMTLGAWLRFDPSHPFAAKCASTNRHRFGRCIRRQLLDAFVDFLQLLGKAQVGLRAELSGEVFGGNMLGKSCDVGHERRH